MIKELFINVAFSTLVAQTLLVLLFVIALIGFKKNKSYRMLRRAYVKYFLFMCSCLILTWFTSSTKDSFFVIDYRFFCFMTISPAVAIVTSKTSFSDRWINGIKIAVITYLIVLVVLNLNKSNLNLKFGVFLKRFNYVGLFVGFIGIYFFLIGHLKSGLTISVLTWLIGLTSLAKWTIVPFVSFPIFLLLKKTVGKRLYLKISLVLIVGVSGTLFLLMSRDKVASSGGYKNWDEYWSRRVTRENVTIKHETKIFNYFSDGGRIYLWSNRLEDWRSQPFLGAGLGLSRDVDVDDHNLIVFLLARIGLIGITGFIITISKFTSKLIVKNKLNNIDNAQKKVLYLYLTHNIISVLVGQGFFCPFYLISDFATLGLLVNPSISNQKTK